LKIGIDARLINGDRRGMGNVLYNILMHLHAHLNDNIILYFDREVDHDLKILLEKYKYELKVLKGSNYFIWEQIILPKEVKKDKLDIFWHPYNTGSLFLACPQIVSIHDVIFMKSRKDVPYSKSLYQILGRIYRKFNTPKIAHKAKRIITISNHAKKDIAAEIKGVDNKIDIVYNGCDKSIEKISDFSKWEKFKEKYNIKDKFIFCLGAVEPRKNTIYTIKVFDKFIKKNNLNTQLIICGVKNWGNSQAYSKVKELGIQDQVIFLDYVPNDILDMLYIKAYLFLFLSFYEGFGLPILEAMSLRTPVITTSVSSMPEIAGDAAIITAHNNIDVTLKDLEEIYFNEELYRAKLKKGAERVKLFTWENSACGVVKIIESMKMK